MTIQGKVYDHSNNEAIGNAEVYASNAAGEPLDGAGTGTYTQTNTEGLFTVESGTASYISSRKSGFDTKTIRISDWQFLHTSAMMFALNPGFVKKNTINIVLFVASAVLTALIVGHEIKKIGK